MPKKLMVGQKSLFNEVEVKTKDSFARSTNLKYDFQNPKSLDHLVLSTKFQNFFDTFSSEVLNENSRSRVHVISGTPGTGKSTFALFLARIFSRTGTKQFQQRIEDQRANASDEFRKTWKELDSKAVRLLPLFLNGDEGEIEEAFVSALAEGFSRIGYADEFETILKEDTQQYLKLIRMWEQDYPTKYEEFKSVVETETKKEFSSFVGALRKGSRPAQQLFDEAYREVTGGAIIRQFAHSQVVELYSKANRFLMSKKYAGIIVFYDEFGKYLERGVRNPSDFDLHFIQDFAEACNSSGKNQLHLALLTHLPISQYAAALPTSVQQEWSKIEGRFLQVSFNDGAASAYNLIATAFESNLKMEHPSIWRAAKKQASDWRESLEKTRSLHSFTKIEDFEELCASCFPLHPCSLGLLPLLSEKVAQNERTLFSFLTRDEEHSLKWFVKHHEESDAAFSYLTPAALYRYFRPLIANDVGIGGTYKIFLVAEKVLNTLMQEQLIEREVVSLLAIAAVIGNRSVVKPSAETLTAMLVGIHSGQEVQSALDALVDQKLVLYDKVNDDFALFEGSSIDLREEIAKCKPRALTSDGYTKILRTTFKRSFLIPKKYNFSAAITRFLTEELVAVEALEKSLKQAPEYFKEDGRVLYVAAFSRKELDDARTIISNSDTKSTIVVLPNEPLEIESDLLELHAIEQIYSMKELLSANPNAKRELDHYRATCIAGIQKSCQMIYSMTRMNCSAFYLGQCKSNRVTGLPKLSDVASSIMEAEYNKAPRLNNEMINKRRASNPIIQARIRLVDQIDHANESKWGIVNTGPEFSILQSLLAANQFKVADTGRIEVLTSKSALKPLFEDFLDFLAKTSNGPVLFQDLIDRWVKPPFGVRAPLLPIYLSIFTRITPSPVSFYLEGQFVAEHDSLLFENLLKQPKKYSLQMVEVTPKLLKALKDITDKFSELIPGHDSASEISGFLDSAKVVSQFFALIPEYSRRSSALSQGQRKLITALETFRQPEEFFLKSLPSIYSDQSLREMQQKDVTAFLSALSSDLREIFNLYVDLLKAIAAHTRNGLIRLLRATSTKQTQIPDTGAPLAKLWRQALEAFPADVRDYPYGGVTQKFIGRVLQLNPQMPNQLVIETLADALTGSSPRDWNDRGKYLYEFNFDQALNHIVQMHVFMSDDKAGHATITTVGENGKPVTTEVARAKVDEKLRQNIEEKLKSVLNGLTTSEINSVLLEWLFENNKNVESGANITTKSKIGEAWG